MINHNFMPLTEDDLSFYEKRWARDTDYKEIDRHMARIDIEILIHEIRRLRKHIEDMGSIYGDLDGVRGGM